MWHPFVLLLPKKRSVIIGDSYMRSLGKIICYIAVMLLMCSLAGCGDEKAAIGSNIYKNTVVLAAYRHLAPGEKDGFYCSKILDVWEPLITNDEITGKPAPCLAERWEMADGGRTWRFYLKKNVVFHDGSKFNADSVIANIQRMKKGLKRSGFYNLDINNFYPSLDQVRKIDEYTLEFTFKKANINQLYNMMNFGSAMYAPACLDDEGNFSGVAIGTGPFYIAENKLGQYVRLVRFDQYHGEKAESREIIIKKIPSADTRFSALKSGEIMGVLDLNAMPPVLAEELVKDSQFAVSTCKSTMVSFLLVNGNKFPFNDVRMRKAISLLIDRQVLTDSLYLGYAVPTVNILSYSSPFHKDYAIEHDVELAKKLAQDVLQGERAKIVYCINGAEPLQKGEAELLAYWFGEIGLDVEIQPLEYAVMTDILKKGEYNLARSQQGLPNGDPQFIFNYFLMPNMGRNKSNSLGYVNNRVPMLMEQLSITVDKEQRKHIYDEIQDISVDELPVIPLYYDENIVVYNRKLTGYQACTYGVSLNRIAVKE